jgi:mono/diheme cytochrome c family protein
MRHQIVTRIVVSLAALFVAAVALFAWSVTQPPAPTADLPAASAGPTGDALFSRHCAMCHEAGDIGLAYREAADREAAVAAFREFLVDHYGPSPNGIALIVSHVMELDARSSR